MSSLASLPLLLLAAVRPTLDVGLRSEGRVRSLPEGQVAVRAAELQLEPRGLLGLLGGTWQLSAAYAPRLTATVVRGEGRRLEALHQAELRGGLLLGAGWEARLEQRGRWGLDEPARLLQPPDGGGTVDPVLGAAPLPYVLVESRLRVAGPAGRRVRLGAGAGYVLDGAASQEAADRLPLRRRLEGFAGAQVDVGRRDVLDVTAAGTAVELASGPAEGARAVVLELQGAWQHALARTTTLRLGAGVGAGAGRGAQAEAPEVRAVPLASAELTHAVDMREGRVEGRVGVRHAPYVDRLTGAVTQRVEGSVRGAWVLQALRFDVGASGARSLRFSPRTALASVELSSTWGFSPLLGLVTGLRSHWQQVGEGGARLEHVAFLGLTLAQRGGAP